MAKRKSLSKKTRFEVFKRDSFTCQYCGVQAPDTILQVDHIEPVSKGGTNELINLVTSCKNCNSGKSDRKLSDQTVAKKQKQQLDELQERKNQLDMMAEWQKGLLDIEGQQVDIINDILITKTGRSLNEYGRNSISKLINKHGVKLVSESLKDSISQYFDDTDRGMGLIFDKLPVICNSKKYDPDGFKPKAFYIRAVLRNRGIQMPEDYDEIDMIMVPLKDIGFDNLYQVACKCSSWDELVDMYCDIDTEMNAQNKRDNNAE